MRRLGARQHETAKRAFERIWAEALVIELTPTLAGSAASLAERQHLRAYGAIHVATAVAAAVLAIVTADGQQRRVAEHEGLCAVDPEWVR
jgi:predicted nucleic acid-binding protein